MKTQLTKTEEIVLKGYQESEYRNDEGKNVLADYELVNEGVLTWHEIKIANECLFAKGYLETYTNEEDVDNYCLIN